MRFAGDERVGREAFVEMGVADIQRHLSKDRVSAERNLPGRFGHIQALHRLEPLSIGVDQITHRLHDLASIDRRE